MANAYDILIIGSGPGGYPAGIRAAQLGMKVAVIERETLGGICLNWGCIPTKALLKSAEVYDYLQHAEDYGLSAGGASFDFNRVVDRSRGVADGMNKGIEFLFKKNKVETIMGEAKLKSKTEVDVTGQDGKTTTYSAKHIILAVGGRARELPGLEIDGEHIIEYRKAMTLEQLPKKLVIMGSGAIGCEFAYFYSTMGTEVTLVEYMDRILPASDKDVSRELARSFKKRGIKTMTGAKVTKADKHGKGVKVTIETKKGEEVVEADKLLSAVGVVANTERLGLEALGIETEKGLIKTDGFKRTNVENIYAIGDCTPGAALAHKATAEAILCVETIAGMDNEPIDHNNVPACTYTQPEVAQVGHTEEQAKEAGYELKVGKFPFKASGKAKAAGKADGFVKVIFDAKYGEFLGAHLIGYNVTELIAEVVAARKLETTGHEILKSVHPHPTMSEAVMEATAEAYGEVIHI